MQGGRDVGRPRVPESSLGLPSAPRRGTQDLETLRVRACGRHRIESAPSRSRHASGQRAASGIRPRLQLRRRRSGRPALCLRPGCRGPACRGPARRGRACKGRRAGVWHAGGVRAGGGRAGGERAGVRRAGSGRAGVRRVGSGVQGSSVQRAGCRGRACRGRRAGLREAPARFPRSGAALCWPARAERLEGTARRPRPAQGAGGRRPLCPQSEDRGALTERPRARLLPSFQDRAPRPGLVWGEGCRGKRCSQLSPEGLKRPESHTQMSVRFQKQL